MVNCERNREGFEGGIIWGGARILAFLVSPPKQRLVLGKLSLRPKSLFPEHQPNLTYPFKQIHIVKGMIKYTWGCEILSFFGCPGQQNKRPYHLVHLSHFWDFTAIQLSNLRYLQPFRQMKETWGDLTWPTKNKRHWQRQTQNNIKL